VRKGKAWRGEKEREKEKEAQIATEKNEDWKELEIVKPFVLKYRTPRKKESIAGARSAPAPRNSER